MKWTENENENLTQEEAEDRKWVLVEKGGRTKEEVEEKEDSRGLGCTPTVPHYMELK